MIPHMPLPREAEAFSIPHGASDCARAGEARHRIQRFWSLWKALISTPPNVQVLGVRTQQEGGSSPWFSVPWDREWEECSGGPVPPSCLTQLCR